MQGPDCPELLVITSSAATSYCRKPWIYWGVEKTGGAFKARHHLAAARLACWKNTCLAWTVVLIVEEGTPFMEDNIEAQFAQRAEEIGPTKVFTGARDKTIPFRGRIESRPCDEGTGDDS